MYICKECGDTYTENDAPKYKDFTRFGEKHFIDDCFCGGELVEANECEICGEYTANTFCEDCLTEYQKPIKAKAYGDTRKESVEINGYLAFEFTASQIEEILWRELQSAIILGAENKAKEFCGDDIVHFEDWLKKGGKELWNANIVKALTPQHKSTLKK